MSARPGPFDPAERLREAERMDDPSLHPEEHRRALDGLRRINRVSLAGWRVWREVRELDSSFRASGRPLRVLDVACGGGDVLHEVGRRARASGVEVELHGCDVSPLALRHAERGAPDGVVLTLSRIDALNGPLPGPFDLVTCSLFLHHLSREDAVMLLERMKASVRHRLFVQDLLRTRLGWALAWVGVHTLTTSEVVRTDGLRSVRAAFSLAEARDLAVEAGLSDARPVRVWPERFVLRWDRP